MKRKLTWFVVAALAAFTALFCVQAGLGAPQAITKVAAKLNQSQEVPSPSFRHARARGRFEAVLSGKGKLIKLRWSLRWSYTSGKVRQAHIHLGRPGKAGRIIVGLCGPCGAGSRGGSAGGVIGVSARIAKEIRSGVTYVNLHTKKNPKGEIRGQIKRSNNIGR